MAKIMKDGKPSTSFSRQDREWVKSMGGGGGGGDITVEALTVTENGTYTAEEGKAYSPVTVNVPGFLGTSDATITLSFTFPEGAEGFTPQNTLISWACYLNSTGNPYISGNAIPYGTDEVHVPYTTERASTLYNLDLIALSPEQDPNNFQMDINNSTYSGGITLNSGEDYPVVTGDGHIDVVLNFYD